MKNTSIFWFSCAARLMPRENADWLSAMKIEHDLMASPSERNDFAFGCFKTAALSYARSRKGLSTIARSTAAAGLFILSCAAIILWTSRIDSQPETIAIAKLISALAVVYMCGAVLLMTSLRGLKVFAALGFGAAVLSWAYCVIARPEFEYLTAKFLTALSFEASGIMAGLFGAAIYLKWLYSPDLHDA